ncbi:MAG TPA: DUF1697 domain-containing protein [Candidatus Saccharimonadales bacterium]|nr:DUF1697 domain-containing protein [Candidatus Saccharimonadales bacterium]
MKNIRYAAFLRGINVGKAKQVKMAELKKAFESLGFQDVKTLLNSGNVIFDADEKNEKVVTKNIEDALEKTFGWRISTLLRPIIELQNLVNENPFKDITVTPQTRLYVTFLTNKPDSTIKLSSKDYTILHASNREVCSVITITPEKNTTDLMKNLEQKNGKNITTRNWNTVQRILKA